MLFKKFLLYSEMNHCMHACAPSLWRPPPTAPTPALPSEPRAASLSQSRFPLVICFTHGSVCTSVLLSQCAPPLLPLLGPRAGSLCLQLTLRYITLDNPSGPDAITRILKSRRGVEEQVRVFAVRRTLPAIAVFGDGRRVAEMGAASGDWKRQGVEAPPRVSRRNTLILGH